jgi:hypothetical protein
MHSGAIKNNNLYLEGFMKRINMSLLALLLAIGAPIGAMENNTATMQKNDKWYHNVLGVFFIGASAVIGNKICGEKHGTIGALLGASLGSAGVIYGLEYLETPTQALDKRRIDEVLTPDKSYIITDNRPDTTPDWDWSGRINMLQETDVLMAKDLRKPRNAQEKTKALGEAAEILNDIYWLSCSWRTAQLDQKQADYCTKLYDVLTKYGCPFPDEFKKADAVWRSRKQ